MSESSIIAAPVICIGVFLAVGFLAALVMRDRGPYTIIDEMSEPTREQLAKDKAEQDAIKRQNDADAALWSGIWRE